MALDFKMFRDDGDICRAGNVDCPDAIQVVVVVAGIVKARGGDDCVVGSDGTAAVAGEVVFLKVVFIGFVRLVRYSRTFVPFCRCKGDQ